MRRGFTLVEMLVVVVLFLIVGGFGGRLFYQTMSSISQEHQSLDAHAVKQTLVRQMRQDVWRAQSIEGGEGLTIRSGEKVISYEFVPGKVIRHAEETYTYVLATPTAMADGKAKTGKMTVDRGVASVDCGDGAVVMLLSPVGAGMAGGAR